MSSTIDPTVEHHVQLTDAHRAIIARHNLTVTFEFGHVCIMSTLAVERLGKASGQRRMKLVGVNNAEEGRVHDDAQHFDELLESMVEVAGLAQGALPSFAEMPAAPSVAPKIAKRTKKAAAVVEHIQAKTDTDTTEDVALVVVAPTAAIAPKKVGVIGALVALLSDGNRRTREQLYTALALEFPDRASDAGGMRITIGVQLRALKGKGHKIQCVDKMYWI